MKQQVLMLLLFEGFSFSDKKVQNIFQIFKNIKILLHYDLSIHLKKYPFMNIHKKQD